LKDDAPKSDVAPVSLLKRARISGGVCRRGLQAAPVAAHKTNTALFECGLKLSFSAPAAGEAPFDEYLSDPAKPVPYAHGGASRRLL